jgi:hypothetical protein
VSPEGEPLGSNGVCARRSTCAAREIAMWRVVVSLAVALLCLAGCPSTSSEDPNATTDPNTVTDPNAAATPTWLDGDWVATATSAGESNSGCITITLGKVTKWGHGCAGQLRTLLATPAAVVSGDTANISVTVFSLTGGITIIDMQLLRVSDTLATGTITTVNLGSQPYLGSVTLTRQ